MNFSLTEIYCLNSLIDTQPIFGLPLKNNEEGSNMQTMDYIVKNLIQKNILNISKQITQMAIPVVESIRLYKSAEEYLFLNDLRISLNNDESVTIFIKKKKEYELVRTHSKNLFSIIHSTFPEFFSFARNECEINFVTNVTMQDWEQNYESEKFTSFLAMGKYKKGSPFPVSEKIYASNQQKQFIYNLKKKETSSSHNIVTLDLEKELSVILKEGA